MVVARAAPPTSAEGCAKRWKHDMGSTAAASVAKRHPPIPRAIASVVRVIVGVRAHSAAAARTRRK